MKKDSEDDRYRFAAMEEYCSDDIEIDRKAKVSSSEEGAWVAAWVWVENAADDPDEEPEDDRLNTD